MQKIIEYIKKGNVSSGIAALGNTFLAVIKGVAAYFSGSGSMFATAMHSMADAINQGFVFFGSVLSELPPSERFPTGFGRVINIFCMVAVIVVSIMAYETIKEGWHLFQHPSDSGNIWLNVGVLVAAFLIDGFILIKAMKEINKEADAEGEGFILTSAFKNAGKASPATRLVFYEDLVATSSAVFAMAGVLLAQTFGVLKADGIFTMIIGVLMFLVAFRVGYDNMIGLIGVSAPSDVEKEISKKLLKDDSVVDIYRLRTVQEGRTYHVESTLELKKGLSLGEADDIKFRLSDELLRLPEVSDVVLGIIEDNGDEGSWKSKKDNKRD
ncbi:cation diffusion facilitator family transporter [Virgibacillus doumboii]|uniref:cation diffusion facilitator family transporter n=1 Tax=Virgibacillus doumboii TaxID=2697503 RepID=UPI0013E07B35|nr:cation diffusion facilitator family transporter [Virgibacillus doumboii]